MNLTTLENRLHVLIKNLRMNNHNQRFPRVNSSGSIGTMIPTPGMTQSANSALIGTSSVDSSMAAGSTIASSTVNAGSFVPMANVSSSGTFAFLLVLLMVLLFSRYFRICFTLYFSLQGV